MTFLHTSLLAAGLACIAIPIIIHLLMNRRRKPVMWGAMRFLEEAFRRTRRRLLLEKWLLLAARCLLVALIALALARPLIGSLGAAGNSGRTVYLVIDNSLAAQVADESGATALDRHKAAAKEALAALTAGRAGNAESGDRIALVALGAPAEPLILPPAPDTGAIAPLIDAIAPTAARADFAGAMALIAGSLRPESAEADAVATAPRPDRAVVILFSDFFEGSADLGPEGASTAAQGSALAGVRLPRGVTLIATEPAPQGTPNVSITAVEPLRSVVLGAAATEDAAAAGSGEQVRISLRRSGPGIDGPLATTVRARLGAPDAEATSAPESRIVVRWSPGQETITTAIALPPVPLRDPRAEGDPSPASAGGMGGAVITVAIDRDALDGDNQWRRPVEVREALRVGIVAPTRFGRAGGVDRLDAAAWIRIALAPRAEGTASGGEIEVVNIEPASLDAARLAAMDAVFLPRPDLLPDGAWARIRLFIENGGLAVVMPPADVNVHLWGDAFTRALEPGWTPARQAREISPRTGPGARLSLPAATGESAGSAPRLLSLIEGELEELLRPVGVWRALPMEDLGPAHGEMLLALPDGSPALWAGPIGVRESAPNAAPADAVPPPAVPAPGAQPATASRGMLAYLAIAPDLQWSDLPTKPLMVPVLNELTLQGVGRARGAAWTIAGTRPNIGRRAAELVRVAGSEADSAETVQLDPEGVAREAIRDAGLWRARDERGGRRGLLAVNPDPAAGRTAAQSREAVGAWLAGAVDRAADDSPAGTASPVIWLPTAASAGAAAPVAAQSVGAALREALGTGKPNSPISLPLLVGALALALIELALARWASHASIIAPGADRAGGRSPLAAAGGAA